jgi:hypothetical protein
MATFGKTAIGGTTGGTFTDQSYVGTWFTAPEDGTITKIWFYAQVPFAGSPVDFKTAIYSRSSNLPLTLLASSAGVGSIPLAFAWASCDISYVMTNGEELFLSAWVNDAYDIKYDSGTTDQSFEKYNQTYPTWITPINTGADFNAYTTEVSIYAEYTPAGPPSPFGTPSIRGIQVIKGIQAIKF